MNLIKEPESNDPDLQFSPFALTDIKGNWEYLVEQGEAAAGCLIKEIIGKCELFPEIRQSVVKETTWFSTFASFPSKNTTSIIFRLKTALKFIVFCTVRETTFNFSTIHLTRIK